MRKIYFLLISIFSLFVLFSCAEEMEDKEANQKEEQKEQNYEHIVGNWQLNDIVFLMPASSPELKKEMESRKIAILQGVIKMSFKENYTIVENVNGQFRNGNWDVKNDSIVNVTFEGVPGQNSMTLRSYNQEQLQFLIGTPTDQSLYVFKRVEQ